MYKKKLQQNVIKSNFD